MHIAHVPKLRNDLPNLAIRNYIQTDEVFEIFQFPDFCVQDISRTNKVRNTKSCAHCSHVTSIHFRLINRA